MKINEVVKNFLNNPQQKKDDVSSVVPDSKVLNDLDDTSACGVFFDNNADNFNIFSESKKHEIVFKQKDKIKKYRQLAMNSDVVDAIDEIVNEIIWSYDDKIPLKIDIDEENEKVVEAITDKFNKIMKLMNIRKNIFNIVKSGYVDGQLILHCAYDKNNTKNGIKSIKLIDPCLFYYDNKDGVYKYAKEEVMSNPVKDPSKEYSIEEIVCGDFSLYDGSIKLSYLEYALKPANILKTLEDLLVPLRFSRSISRRVFNVDIGDLPTKRGAEVMKEHQNKFKYKKFYNNETGEVTNQQHITSMVEDYWFSNRSGGKGTTVDVLDESGNLGELDDILYYVKKVYRAMKIPSNRISINPDGDNEFDYDTTRVSKEDMKFFMFISRLRQVYSDVLKEILKREVISTGILSEAEWDEREELISIFFVEENKFIEKMKLSALQEKINIYSDVKEYAGTLFSHREAMKKIFRYSDEEIDENLKEIAKEEKDAAFSKFYQVDEF